jgi:hypothetical protein
MKALISLAILPAAACTGAERGQPADSAPVSEAAAPEAEAAQDSLVLRAPGGVEVWYTLSRSGQAADGSSCVDRTLEIRREGLRIPVPLLYTGSAPELVDDTTMRARLSNACVPGQSYLVNLRTGRPTPER